MKRTWMAFTALVVAVMLIVGLTLALAHSPGRNPATWEDVTYSYIKQRGWTWGQQVTIKQAVKARTPDNFTQDSNFHTYSAASPYYTVDETASSDQNSRPGAYAAGDLITETILSTPGYNGPSTATTSSGFRMGRPIPYPPTEVWCVLLKLASTDTYFVVFANLHQDMYNAQWIIHEGEKSPFSQTFLERVASLGCDLDLANLPSK